MSKESAGDFCRAVAGNEALFSEVVALSRSEAGARTVQTEQLVALGARRGFVFSAEEFTQVWGEWQAARAGRQLSDADLEAVSGGIGELVESRQGEPRSPASKGAVDFELSDDFAP
jgi:hypothetical protein